MRRTQSSISRSARSAFEPLEQRALFAAGALDPSFGNNGVVFGNPSDFTGRISAIDVQSDGKIVAVGSYSPTTISSVDAAVVRFNADGTIDRSFGGGDGIALLDTGGLGGRLTDVELLADGDIVAVGTAQQFLLATRLNADGSPDTAFATDGVSMVSLTDGDRGRGMRPMVALDVSPAGEIFAAGEVRINRVSAPLVLGTDLPAVVKLTAAGALDTSFADRGVWSLPLGLGETSGDRFARDVKIQNDGRIVTIGDVDDWGDAFVARLTPGGAMDNTFSDDGLIRIDFDNPTSSSTGNALAIQDDGRIILGGSGRASATDHSSFRVARLTPAGAFDTTFGVGGISPFGFGGVDGMPSEVMLQSDGKIVAGGPSTRFSKPGFLLGRLKPNGGMDYSFGVQGRVYTPLPVVYQGSVDRAADMDLLDDGRIVMAGNNGSPGGANTLTNTPVLARYLNDAAPPPPPPPDGDAVVIQAEDNAGMRGAVVAKSNPGYTGTGYVDFIADSGASVTWNVGDFTAPGNYSIEFRYANGSGATRSLAFDTSAGPGGTVAFPPTGSWSTWKTVTVPVTLAGGKALSGTLRTTGKNGPNIDSLTARQVGAPPPTSLVLQAEQAALVGAKARSDNPGFAGTGYADYSNASGDSVEWTFDNPGGTRTLTFRYANGAATDRPLELRVNGNVVNSRLSFVPSGTWAQWRQISVTVSLVSGTNRVKLTSIGSNGPNIDQVTVG